MVKILSQAGMSLADTYNVEGSIAGVEQLRSEEVQLVHEMGTTILSERMASTIQAFNPGAIAQSTGFDVRWVFLPNVISRLVNVSVCVVAAEGGRIGNAQVSIETLDSAGAVAAEIPIWMWNATDSFVVDIEWSNQGAAAAEHEFLVPRSGPHVQLPYLTVGTLSRFSSAMIQFRGATTAFGAGTVTPLVQLHVNFPLVASAGPSPSSFGLPVPSW